MGLFERYLSVWIGLAIVTGVGLGTLFPDAAASIALLKRMRINQKIDVFFEGFSLLVDFACANEK